MVRKTYFLLRVTNRNFKCPEEAILPRINLVFGKLRQNKVLQGVIFSANFIQTKKRGVPDG